MLAAQHGRRGASPPREPAARTSPQLTPLVDGLQIKCEMDGQGVAFWPRNADGNPDKAKEFYVGLYARVAARFGISPFILQLTGDDYVNIEEVRASGRRVVDGAELQVFDWVERPVIPIGLRPDLDPPEQARRVIEEVEAVRALALDSGQGVQSPM